MDINLFITITAAFCLTIGIVVGCFIMKESFNISVTKLNKKLLEERKDNLRLEQEKKWLLEELVKKEKADSELNLNDECNKLRKIN